MLLIPIKTFLHSEIFQAVQLSASSNIVIGSADISETDLEKIDGITNGTGAANKALVLDVNADITAGLRNLTITGDLTVQGTTTTIDSTTINISQSFTFEGPADDYETVLHAGTPVADTTINLPALAAGTYHLPVIAGAATAASALVTADEFAQLDGGQNRLNITIVDADGFLMNDGGTMKHVSASAVATYVGNNIAETVQSFSANGNVSSSAGAIILAQSASSAYTLTLEPAADSSGKIFKIKREDGQNVTIDANGSEKIDDDTSIVLESQYAAVMLFSNGTQYFVI